MKSALRLTVLAAAVIAGAYYAFSPLTGWCLLWMAVLVRWTAKDLVGRERHWVLATLGAALAMRLIAISLLPLLVDPQRQTYASYFGDAHYAVQRSIWIRNVALGIPIGPLDYIFAFDPVYDWSGYNYVLAFLHILFGPSPYGVTVFSTGLWLTAAAVLFRLCRQAFGPVAAFGGLAATLFMPSVFAWSVAPLKEAMQFLVLTLTVASLVGVVRGRWPVKVSAVIGVVLAIAMGGALRNGGAAIPIAGTGVAAVLWLTTRRAVLLPATAMLMLLAISLGAQSTSTQRLVAGTVTRAAHTHLGHARSPGTFYRLLDDTFYADPGPGNETHEVELRFDQALRFLIRAPIKFFVEPQPWAVDSPKWLMLIPQQTLWYVAIPLALVGAIRGLWRQPLLTSLLIGMIVGGVVVIAPNSGNTGTLIRHRDMVVPFVLMLASFGAFTVAERLAAIGTTRRLC